MRFFDEKGRVFGLINIIDLLVILVILVAAGGVYYVRFSGLTPSSRVEEKTIEAVFLVNNVRMATVNVIKPGDKVRESKSNTFIGEVVGKDVQPTTVTVVQPDGTISETSSTSRKDVYVKVRGTGSVSENAIMMGSQEMRIGVRVQLKTNMWAVETTVMEIVLK